MPDHATTVTLASIQVGRVITEGDAQAIDPLRRPWTTGFYKRPVEGTVAVTRKGFAGDAVADTKHHGGPDKAVLAYAAAHYPDWRTTMGIDELPQGAFGENLTIDGCEEADVHIGDRWRCGEVLFEVSQPRQPCWKLARRWQRRSLVKEVAQSGRTGWYLRVIATGKLAAGDEMVLIERPHPEWTVARANDVLFGRLNDRSVTMELMMLPQLADAWKKDMA